MAPTTTCCPPTSSAQATGLTVAALKAVLHQAPDAVVSLIWPDGEPIEAHVHVTEIGRIQKDFVDCGGTVRQQLTCLLQLWSGEDTEHRLTGRRLLTAFSHAARILTDDTLPCEVEYEACNVVQLVVASAVVEDGTIVLRLGSKHTDCLAKDVCCAPAAGERCGC